MQADDSIPQPDSARVATMTESALTMKWWQALPEDFYRQTGGTELDADYRLKVTATAAVDVALRSVVSALVSAAMAPTMANTSRLHRQMRQMQRHQQLADAADSEAVFGYTPKEVQEIPSHVVGYHPRGVDFRLLCFDSLHETLNPALAAGYQRSLKNSKAYAQHWVHRDGPRPTLILIHGFGVDAYWFNAQMFSLRWFYRRGYDILLYTLPFHGYRVESLDWFSGYRLFSNGLPVFNEAMVHAVRDVRVFMDYLQSRGVPSMGVGGLSLGGYVSALMGDVEDRLAFCIPNSPVVSPIDIAREWQPSGALLNLALKHSGLSVRDLRHALAVHNPLTYAPKIDSDRVLIIGGAGDRFTPPRHVRLLHRHFAGSQLHWFPGNHLLHFNQGKYLHLMKDFMDRCCGL